MFLFDLNLRMKVFIMSFIKKFGIFTMVFVGLQLNYLQAADNSMWSKDISDPYWKVQKAVIDRARGSQLQSILDLKRPEGYSDEAWDALRNSVNNSLLNDEVVYAPRQRVQVEAAERSGQSDRVEPEDISVAEFANNAVRMYPQLVEGFEVLRQTGQEVPTLHDFVQRQLRISSVLQEFMEKRSASGNFVEEEQFDSNQGLAFHNTIAAAEDVIIGGMKDRFLQILKTAIVQRDENIAQNQDPIFQYVLKYGVGITYPDGSVMNTKEFMKPVVKQWVNNVQVDYWGVYINLLHIAAAKNATGVAQILIAAGAQLNEKNASGNSPLHEAVKSKALQVAQILIDAGAQKDEQNFYFNKTPLHIAVFYDVPRIVQMLLTAGANTTIVDYKGKTAEQYAITLEMRALFEQAKAARAISSSSVGV